MIETFSDPLVRASEVVDSLLIGWRRWPPSEYLEFGLEVW